MPEIILPQSDMQYADKERIFIVRVTKHIKPGWGKLPFLSVSYNDESKQRHLIEAFAQKPEDIGVVAGELISRLIPQLGDK
jgi:hypothetical protein